MGESGDLDVGVVTQYHLIRQNKQAHVDARIQGERERKRESVSVSYEASGKNGRLREMRKKIFSSSQISSSDVVMQH